VSQLNGNGPVEKDFNQYAIADAEYDAMVTDPYGDDLAVVPKEILTWTKRQMFRATIGTDHADEFATGEQGDVVRGILQEFCSKCAESAVALQYQDMAGHADKMYRALQDLHIKTAKATISRAPADQINELRSAFLGLPTPFRGVEVDALIAVLEESGPGEVIDGLFNDRVETNKRTIHRLALREMRPASITGTEAIARWERSFPSREEIESPSKPNEGIE
jgi:hypothetical protein